MSVVVISDFSKKVIENIRKIPRGKVATYKQIAELSGKPQGSRGVGWILHSSSMKYKLPWHRVLNSQGKISFPKRASGFKEQKRKLEQEGVVLTASGTLSLAKFQWKKKAPKRTSRNKPKMFS